MLFLLVKGEDLLFFFIEKYFELLILVSKDENVNKIILF